MAQSKDRRGMPLQARMSEVLAYKTAFPESTWREIGLKCNPPVKDPQQAYKYYKSALKRLGNEQAEEVGTQLALEHRLAKIQIKKIDRIQQATKFRNTAEWIVDELNDLTAKERKTFVRDQTAQASRVAKQATEIANTLEGLPDQIIEVHDPARMAEVMLKMQKELERRGLRERIVNQPGEGS